MTSTVILSDNGASSGSAGLKSQAGNDGVLILQTTTSGGTATNAVYVTNTQRVGLGTTSPGTVFQVVGQSAAGIYSSSPSTAGNNYLLAASSSYNYGVVGVKTGDGTSTGDVYQLGVVASAGGTSSGILQWGSASNCVGLSTTPATSGTGITFPATQSASTDANTLDDYEEGTWTPQLLSDATGASNYTTQVGYYRKIGGQVTVWFAVSASTIPAGTYLRINGLPFSVASSGTGYQGLNYGSSGKTPIYLETYIGTSGQAFQTASGYANPASFAGVGIGGVYTYCAA